MHSPCSIKLLIVLLLLLPLYSSADVVRPDSILTVTQARKDANKDLIPDLLGKLITVGGRANVYSGVIHADRFVIFLEDEESGIGLYSTEFGAPVAEGDSVIATGVVDQFEGLTRLIHVTYRTVIVHRPMPPPLQLHTHRANSERYEGKLISVEGEIICKWNDVYGSYLGLRERRDDADTMIVFLISRHKPGIDFGKYEVGDRINVVGILAQFVRGGPLDKGYEMFPRYPDDIRVLATPARTYLAIVYTIGGILVVALGWVFLLRRQVSRRTKQLRESEDRFRSVFEGAKDVMLVLNDEMKIEDINPAACQLIGLQKDHLLAKSLGDIFPAESLPAAETGGIAGALKGAFEFETTLMRNKTEIVSLLAKMNVYTSGKKRRVILILRDITERTQAQKEREKLIHDLTEALAEVRTLSGLLPICSSCKKIRDDKGYWKKLEVYFQSRANVQFSHGICPDCIKSLYPDYAARKKKQDDIDLPPQQ